MTARHDITANQGETLNLHLLYTDSTDTVIDLSLYTAELQCRRSTLDSDKLLHVAGASYAAKGITAGATGLGATGFGNIDSGYSGYTGGLSGGIWLNRNAGNTGGQTGGIYIFAGATATSFIPNGKHLYDLELKHTDGTVTRLMEGRLDCPKEVTR